MPRWRTWISIGQVLMPAVITALSVSSPCNADLLCGPRCLQAICARYGVDATLDELARLADTQEATGTTLQGLCRAAAAKGLRAVAMKISTKELLAIQVPAIAHLWGSHFVVCEAGEAGNVRVTNPPGGPADRAVELFESAYSGFAVLVGPVSAAFPAPKTAGPDLRLSEYQHNAGWVDEGQFIRRTIKCSNVGDQDLIISGVETSCDCALVSLTNWTLPPGGSGDVVVAVDTASQRGSRGWRINIRSNDPVSPSVQFRVTAMVRPAQLGCFPAHATFGRVRKGETASIRVIIPDWSAGSPNCTDSRFDVTGVSADKDWVQATVAPWAPEGAAACVDLRLAENAPVGQVSAVVTVRTTYRGDSAITIPMTATVLPRISVAPTPLFLGAVRKGDSTTSIASISTTGLYDLTIDKIDNHLPYVSIDVKPKVEGKEYILSATLRPNAPLGNIKGEITIHTNDPDQPEIRVPVYAYVEDQTTRSGVIK